ncbi:MAG: FAD-binding oxidoreductase [bacterium]|nr:FAD-binding oxidoreductase [bacterium]
MIKTADAVVIGGGIMGASTAHFLAKKGFGKVVLLEKRSLAAVSTGHSAAVVRTFYSNHLTLDLALRALQMFENGPEALGGDCGFRPIGYLCLIAESTLSAGRQVLELEKAHGAEVAEVSLEEMREIMPQLHLDGVIGGILEPHSGYADPLKTVQSLAGRAKDWGLEVCEGVGATGIRLEGNRVAGVETEQGTIDTRVVVNAAGPWGREMGLSVGLNDSIRWSRESDLVLRKPSDFKSFPVISDPDNRIYLRPQGEDEVLAGLGFPKEVEPLDIDNYDPALDARTRQRIEQGIFQRVPDLKDAEYLRGWASLYTISDDWHPIVGPEPELEGYYACFGGSGHGFKLGPPIGESLSDIIIGNTPEIDIQAFRPSRFVEGEIFTSAWGGGNRA